MKITCALALIAALAVAPASLASPAPALSPPAHHVTRRDDGRLQGVYLKTWENGWSYAGIQNMFTSLIGKTDIIYVTFFQPTAAGLDCPAQSPCASVYSQADGADVPASKAYKAGIQAAEAKGIRTLLAIGGWSYRDDFAFLAAMDDGALAAWAQKVRQTVDEFGAHGIDIDYESQTADQWQAELVKTNVIGHLRKAMPASDYVICLTIGGIAAAAGTPEEVQAAFSPPLSTAYPLSGVALPTIKLNYADIDLIQLMTYDGEPNFTPMVCMELTVKALAAMDAPNPQAKLLVGAELGSQFGACNGVSEGWCHHDMSDVTAMAEDVVAKGYRGLFYWPNIDGAQFYDATYPSM